MKKTLLLFLTCGICIGAFSQIDSSKKINPGNSDKWEIIKGNAKSSTGKLFVTLPKGTEWSMTIYAAGTTKVLSNTSLKTSFTLQPGTYDLEINKIRINGVPVEKGNNTRLKAGVLHMTTTDSWTLYDEPKKIVLINSLSPQERGLPIGKYKISLLGQVQDIEITDEVLDEGGINLDKADLAANPYKQWEVTSLPTLPATKGKTLNKDSGRLQVDFLADAMYDSYISQTVSGKIKISRDGYPDILLTSDEFPADGYPLPAGTYQVTLNKVLVANVPIEGNKKTRLKTGKLNVNQSVLNYGVGNYDGSTHWVIFRYGASIIPGNPYPLPESNIYFKTYGTGTITFPVGRYGFFVWGNYPVNEITMGDNKGANIDITLGLAKVTWGEDWDGNAVMWSIYSEDGSKRYASCCNPLHIGQKLQHVFLPIGRYLFKYKDQTEMFTLEAAYIPDELFAH